MREMREAGKLAKGGYGLRGKKSPASFEAPDERIAVLERQMKASKTRIANLRGEKEKAWEAARSNSGAISKADHTKLIKVFHLDSEARVSKAREAQLTEGFQIYEQIGLKII
jgi:hypothetical protein